MTVRQMHLKSLSGRSTRINDNQFRVAAQAIVEGMQDINVMAATPSAGPGHGQIAVRVGRLLVYVNDRAQLSSAVSENEGFCDIAAGALSARPGTSRSRVRNQRLRGGSQDE